MNKKRINKKKQTRRNNKKKFSILRFLFRVWIFSFLATIISGLVIVLYFSNTLPNLDNLQTAVRIPSVVIQTYDGDVLGTYGDFYCDLVSVDDMPEYVSKAFIAIEDKRFFQHFGLDIIGIARAAYKNFITRRVVEGGSTITQQLAKNILICAKDVTYFDKSYSRKIKEFLLAIWLEYKFTKKQILMMYLNRIYFGGGTYGIDAASRKYFGKSAKELTVFEAAVLAGLLKAPSKYNPASNAKNSKERAILVLHAMERCGFIKNVNKIVTQQSEEAFKFNQIKKKNYMYFADYAYEKAKSILGTINDDIVVVTTLDVVKQQNLEKAVEFCQHRYFKRYNCSQIAAVLLDTNGQILAMVGGVDYTSTQFNRATNAMRMLGSVFKIFVILFQLEIGHQKITTGMSVVKFLYWRVLQNQLM